MNSFQVSDLAKQRTAVLDAARNGRAIIKDNKGPELVMLPNVKLEHLELYKEWTLNLNRLRSYLQPGGRPDVAGWGDLAWLRVFDNDDLTAFCDELSDELVIDISGDDFTGLDKLLHEWKATAGQLEDPLRKRVLLSPGLDQDDFTEAEAPAEPGDK